MGDGPLRYDSGDLIRPGDRVEYAGEPGRVVFVHDGAFASLEAAEADWAYLGRGFMVATDRDVWFLLGDDGPNEDLTLIGRVGDAGGAA